MKYAATNTTVAFSIKNPGAFIVIDIENAIEQAIQEVQRLKTEFARASFYQDGFGLGLWITDQLILKNQGVLMLHTTNNTFGAQIKLPIYLAG